ncbi:MAG: hypothetical protein HC833_20545 [Leptolyngbyaceae cyanobacterium RM1_406_9]|nr:hypothetical protein [Leptolyngbyaceae cyanobacterium RM1_406_9]
MVSDSKNCGVQDLRLLEEVADLLKSDRLPHFSQKTVTYHLDELPLTQICSHVKVAFYTQQPHKPKDLAPLKAVDAAMSD